MKPFDERGIFRPTAADEGLRRLAIRGAGVLVLSQSAGFAIQLIATVILARLLAPADFGLLAMVSTFSLLLMNVGLNGFTEALLQKEEIDHGLVSNLFWINAGLGLLLTIGFAASGFLLARFYGDPRVAGVTVAMSATILLTSLSVQHLALLKRAMRFSVVSANDILARTISVTVSIVLGWVAWGYWALVAGAVALPLATTLGAWSACRWVPGAPRRHRGTAAMVRFAMNTYGRFMTDYGTRNLDKLLVGWYFGPQALGFYKKAYDLFVLPLNQLSAPLTNVAVSAMSRLRRDPARRARHFLDALSTLAFVGMGLGAGLTLIGRDLILVLLGPGWEESGRIFTLFGLGIGIVLLYGTHGWIHLSIGRADRWLRWSLVEFAAAVVLFVMGIRWGPAGVAVAAVVSYWILAIPALWYAGQPAHLPIRSVMGAVWRYVLAAALAGCAATVAVRGVASFVAEPGLLAAVTRIVIVSSVFGALYLGAVILLHQGCAPLAQFLALVRDMVPGGRLSRSPATVAATAGTAPSLGTPSVGNGV